MPSRLKSLELQGYKTFANRTLFEFASTITAIVGPNGSGKSNIADSLRWVLGEQSFRLLRARKTEDMIFSGSQTRPRSGLAQATIVFDNNDGWLPIDFSEVAVARRAYRDGQNEYLINGQRVRLKDVTELLAKSGLAERTYTVIGQGLVDAALSLKAEERRRLFEEAAGIGLHRDRREEALRRLEITRRNLERVQDILAELRPRLRSLERQARRAREYDQVKADLQVLLREWYGYHWHRAQQELAGARRAADEQEGHLERARQEQSGLEQELAGIRARASQLRTDMNDWSRKLAGLHTRREAASRQLAVAEERQRSLREQEENIRLELVNRQAEIALYHSQLAKTHQEIKRLKTELQEAQTQAESAGLQLKARLAERARVEHAQAVARQELARLNARHGQVQALISERQARLERLGESQTRIAEALQAAVQVYQQAKTDHQAAQRDEEQAAQALQKAEVALAQGRTRLENIEVARRQTLERQSALAARLESHKARLEVLDQAEAALTGYASGTRLLLQAAQEARLTGARGALSHYLETPAELETAIAAALGEYLDAVLLDGDPDEALDLLEAGAGRGALLPLPDLRPPARPATPSSTTTDVLGIAADLVSAPAELQKVLELLLGDVYVVRDRQTAMRLLAELPPGLRAVSLRGEVFHASGPVQASGGDDASGEHSLLGRARQRRDLKARLAQLEADSASLQGDFAGIAEQLRAAQKALEDLEENRKRALDRLTQTGRAANRARLDLERAEQQATWQAEQRKHTQGEIDRSLSEQKDFSNELVELEKQLDGERQRLRQENAALAGLSLDDDQSQLAHWNTLAAVSERALAEVETRHGERQTALKRAEDVQADLLARLAQIDATRQANLGEQADQRQAEALIADEIKALQAFIEPAEANLALVEGQQNSLQESEAVARQRLSQAEHFHAQTRITLARRQEALQTWQRRIEDDFGLVAFEYDDQVSGPTPLPLDGLVEQLPVVHQVSAELEENLKRQRAQLRRMGAINPEAQAEYREVKERFDFLTGQVADLHQAESDVRQVISELDDLMQRQFSKTFDAVATEFRHIFMRLFDGGSARLVLTQPDDLMVSGVDIEARLPGRRSQGLSLLSGGERSLTATALVFALLKVSPTPFCVLDEVDAMLDETNVGRFRELLRELSANTQFVIVTHNRNTVQAADVIYGVTMGRDSVSQVLSLKLDEVSQVV